MIRSCPKPVIAQVAGWAVGGGHVLHVVCDLTIAADNAQFMQTGPRVGSFDGGFGAAYFGSIVGQKKAREIWYLCRPYSGEEAQTMGLVNTVVPLAECRRDDGRLVPPDPQSTRPSPCAASNRASTPHSTDRQACRNSPETRRCSST